MENNKLEDFKKIVLKAMNLKTESDITMFEEIPDHVHESVFSNNFNNNLQLARKIIFNNFDQDAYKKIENEKSKINDIAKASRHISKAMSEESPILFLTDTDNDGSLAQANILEFKKSLSQELKSTVSILYCQTINGNSARGFTVDLVDAWLEKNPQYKDSNLTIVSADNGINSREEQAKINKKYPNAMLIVTDHHLPDEDSVVLENKKTMIVNPKYKPNKYFQDKNISGANVLGTLLEKTLTELETKYDAKLKKTSDVILNMREISRMANLLDYVDTDISDKPLKDYLVEKYSSLGSLMNVNNSLNKIITSKHTDEEVRNIFSDVENLDVEEVILAINKIKEQNKLAEKMLTLQHRYDALTPDVKAVLPKGRIHKDLIIELDKKDHKSVLNNINPNFVEQLRPYILNYAASSTLTDYESGIQERMKDVFSNIKKQERVLQNVFGSTNLMNIEKLENGTIMYPKSNEYLKLLNRKLLGKIYNEENNGLLMILDNIEKQKATGSFRSVYRIQDILKGKESLENALNIKVSFQGHDKAAGFFIESADGSDLNTRVIADVNKFINKRLDILKQEDKRNYSHLIQTDFEYTAIELFNKYNKAIKGSLTNMQSLSPVIQFNKSTYLTNSKTQKEQNLQQLIADKKYGYIPVEVSFDGRTIILPTELLRQIVDSNFKDAIQVSFMNDGVFIGNKVIPNVNKQKLTKIRKKENKRQEMIDFFKEHYEPNGCFTELDINYLKKSPFFKYNKYGENEYKRYESTIINILDKSDTDMLVVADTEANGLGNAPKVSNFGVVELMIDEDSGSKIKQTTFRNAAFKTMDGNKHLLSKTQILDLTPITEYDYDILSFEDKQNVVINMFNPEKRYLSPSAKGYRKLHNVKTEDDIVIVNREIKANIGSLFIKDRDVKISERIHTLTAIDNTLLNKIGMSSEKADKLLTERYKDKKCIFQAHNLPYDLGVIKGNFKNFYDLVTDFDSGNLLNDSAIYSRVDKLAYDPIDIAVFEKEFVPALSGIQFFHSDQSELSVEKFLSNKDDGTLPDRTGRYVLKKKNEKVSIIDKKENTEVLVEVSAEGISEFKEYDLSDDETADNTIGALKELVRKVEMPKNAIKYSVQALSDYDMIRSLILSNSDFVIKPVEVPEIFVESKSTLEFFMMNYHFDASMKENFRNFTETLKAEDYKDLFVTEGFIEEEMERLKEDWEEEQRINPPKRKKKAPNFRDQVGEDPKMLAFKQFTKDFLDNNVDLQGKFHEIWAYKKVLELINPTKETLKDNQKIDLISYQTSLSSEKVTKIMKDAVDFKDHYGVDRVIQKEPHNNLFFDECDVVMESILTFKRPTDRSYNSYTHSAENVVDMYLKNILKTTSQHMISQQRRMAVDSFSKKQADSYKRRNMTKYIEENQKIDIENVKFKFSASTLPTDTFAYGVLKEEVSAEKIEEISKDLEFVARNEQMKHSLSEKIYEGDDGEELMNSMLKILKSNDAKVEAIRDEMGELFEKVYFSRKENDSKKFLQQAVECILENTEITPNRNAAPLMKREKDLVVDLAIKFARIAEKLEISAIDYIKPEEVQIAKGNAFDVMVDKKGNSIEDFIDEAMGEEVLKTDNPLTQFLMSIQEISEEELQEKELKMQDNIKADFTEKYNISNPEEVQKMIARKNIMDVVSISRRDDAAHILSFSELLDSHLSNLRQGIDISIDNTKELENNEKLKAEKEAKKTKPKKKA